MSRSKPPRRNRPQGQGQSDRSSEGEASGAERLQKVLAAAGIGSRRDCEELIREGRVEVDKQVVTELGTKVDPLLHEIRVDGMPIRKPKRIYFAVNKPMGVVTTNFDPSGRMRVIDLVPTEERVFPVGRLDRYSEGLILVTNDGAFANRLTHPRYGVEKTYLVRVAGEPDQTKIAKLKRGIHLSDGFCQVESIKIKGKRGNSTDMIMVLNEGRNREIRRVLARVGHKVLRLKRIAVGPLKLADLPTGAWRKLLPREIELLIDDSHRQEQKAKTAKPQREERRAQRENLPADDEMDESLSLTGRGYSADHVAEDEELLADEEVQGLGGMFGDDEADDSLLADGEFGDDDNEFVGEMDEDDGADEDFGEDEDEDFEIVEISEDDIERPSKKAQPIGDVLAYDDDEANLEDLGDEALGLDDLGDDDEDDSDDESLGGSESPRGAVRGPRRGAAGPWSRRGEAPEGRRSEGGNGPRGRRAGGRGAAGRSGQESQGPRGEAGGFAARRPGTRRKVKGEGGAPYRGGFGSRSPRDEGHEGPERRGPRPGGKRPTRTGGGRPSRAGGESGGSEGYGRRPEGGRTGRAPGKRSGPGARGPGARGPGARGPGARGPGARGPGSRSPGRTGPGRAGEGGSAAGRGGPAGRRPSGGHGGRSGGGPGGRPGRSGPSGGGPRGTGGPRGGGPGGGPRGRGPGSGGPRKGGPRKGGPRR